MAGCRADSFQVTKLFYSSRSLVFFLILCFCVAMVYYLRSSMGNLGIPLGENVHPRRTDSNDTLKHGYPAGILIGVRKAGTGALIKFLSLNPNIKTAHQEVHFFDTEDRYSKGIDWYLQQLPGTEPGQISFEKSPKYFHTAGVPERINEFNPNQKLLVILRDPIKRLISEHYFIHYLVDSGIYHHKEFMKKYGNRSFSDCVLDPLTNKLDTSYSPLDRSRYHRHLKRWLNVFPRSQILIVDGDAYIQQNPAKQLRRVEAFLGVEPQINENMFIYNEEKGFYCPADTECLSNKGHHHPKPRRAAIRALREYFRPLNQALFELIGQRFSWNY